MNPIRTLTAATALAAGILSAQAAAAYERWVDIVNAGDSAIYSVFITHVDDPNYGRDLLGRYVIPAGGSMRVEPELNDGYCRFDVLITYTTGREVTLWGVNLCEATSIFTDGSRWEIYA